MAAVGMRPKIFWLPADFRPNNAQRAVLRKHHRGSVLATANSPSQAAPLSKKAGYSGKPKPTAVTQRYELSAYHGDDSIKAQARDHDSSSYSNRRDSFPSIEELCQEEISHRNAQGSSRSLNNPDPDKSGSCQAQQRPESSVGDGKGSRDSPVILEDDELNVPSVDTGDMPILTAVITTVELKKPTDALNQEARLDIESGPYVLEQCPLPAFEEDDVTSVTVAQDRHLLPGPLEDIIHQHNTGDTQSISEAPGLDTLPELLNEGGGKADNVPELERDIELASKEREDLSMAAPSSPLLHRHSPEPMREQMDKEQDRHGTSLWGLEEPKHSSPHHTQAEEDKPYVEQQKQEAVSAIVMVEDGRSMPDQAELTESRLYKDGRELAGGNANSSGSGSSHSINDENNKEPRPAKRQKWDAHSPSIATSLELFDTEKSEPASLAIEPDQEWEIRNIFGRKIFSGEKRYLVDWSPTALPKSVTVCDLEWAVRKTVRRRIANGSVQHLVHWEPTWMPEFELQGARELIDKFEAEVRETQLQSQKGNEKDGLQQLGRKTVHCNVLAKTGPKRQRGRPRKRTTSLVGEHGSVVSAVNISSAEIEEALSNKGGRKINNTR
ncbi:hypothetical protein OIDMADRAFT_61874 [Oidiodendron maius Zn]|uniref:Chromo domain-containing protein n=1 Tax=Oidiodendron maius (strain Zn) TaxID=913774 RepID=A0A0C3C2J2_OIDMZ|nr:hypothetical protein OIDMADRAFT_61874 [Oidiodendron maius Zn]